MWYLMGELRIQANFVSLHDLLLASSIGQLELYSFQAAWYDSPLIGCGKKQALLEGWSFVLQ